MKLFLFAAVSGTDRMAGSINAALGRGADQAEARLNVMATAPAGFQESLFKIWPAFEIADGAVTLPGNATAIYLGRAHGAAPLSPLPGA